MGVLFSKLNDGIARDRIEVYVRREVAAREAVERSALASAERPQLAAEVMRGRDPL